MPSLNSGWWILIFLSLAIGLFALAWNLMGNALRDILDPRLIGSRA